MFTSSSKGEKARCTIFNSSSYRLSASYTLSLLSCAALTSACGDNPPSPPTTTLLNAPHVTSVALTELDIANEHVGRPVYVDYPMRVEVGLNLDADEFAGDIAIGLETKDGSTRCFVGTMNVNHAANYDQSNPTQEAAVVSKAFYVPPTCRALAGKSDVTAWASFDPFGRLDVQGRAHPTATDSTTLEDFLQQTRIDTKNCKPAGGAGNTGCVNHLQVMDSPGRDLVLANATLSSKVAVVDIQAQPFLPQVSPGAVDDDGNPVEPLDPKQFYARLSTMPHFLVNTETEIFGGDGTDKDALPAGAATIQVQIRPNAYNLELSADVEQLPNFFEWKPVSIEVADGSKGGDPNVKRLLEESVSRLVDAQTVTTEAVGYIDGDLLDRIVHRDWGAVNVFDMQICVNASSVKEANGEDDPMANNCREEQVEILRHRVSATYGGIDDPDQVTAEDAAPEKAFSNKWEETLGPQDKVGLLMRISGGARIDKKYVDLGTNELLRVVGWVPFSIAEYDLAFRDFIDPKTDDEIRQKIVFLNYADLKQQPFPDGMNTKNLLTETNEEGKESKDITKEGPKLAFTQSYGVTVTAQIQFTGTIGATATMTKGKSDEDTCAGGTKVGNACFRSFSDKLNIFDAQAKCRETGGRLAVPSSQAAYDAIQSARGALNVDAVWTGIRHVEPKSKAVGSCKTLQAKYNEAQGRLNACQQANASSCPNPPLVAEVELLKTGAASCVTDFGGIPGYRADWLTTWQSEEKERLFDGVQWLPNNPDDYGDGEGYVAVHATGINDAPATWKLPGVCTYNLGPVGTINGAFKLYGKIDGKFSASVSFGVAEAGIKGETNLIDAEFPNQAGFNWVDRSKDNAVDAYLYITSKFKATALKTKVDYFWKVGSGWFGVNGDGNILNFDGVTLVDKTLMDEKSKVVTFKY